MNNAYSLYEGDSVIRPGPVKYSEVAWKLEFTPEMSHGNTAPEAALDVARVASEARKMRGQLTLTLVQRFWQSLERWFGRADRRRQDAFLAQSTDHADLERRLRQLEQPRIAIN